MLQSYQIVDAKIGIGYVPRGIYFPDATMEELSSKIIQTL